MGRKRIIIYQCYGKLTDAIEKYQDNWMCDETWFKVITSRYPEVVNAIGGFSREDFNRAISDHASQCGAPNELGIFKHQFSKRAAPATMPTSVPEGTWGAKRGGSKTQIPYSLPTTKFFEFR